MIPVGTTPPKLGWGAGAGTGAETGAGIGAGAAVGTVSGVGGGTRSAGVSDGPCPAAAVCNVCSTCCGFKTIIESSVLGNF